MNCASGRACAPAAARCRCIAASGVLAVRSLGHGREMWGVEREDHGPVVVEQLVARDESSEKTSGVIATSSSSTSTEVADLDRRWTGGACDCSDSRSVSRHKRSRSRRSDWRIRHQPVEVDAGNGGDLSDDFIDRRSAVRSQSLQKHQFRQSDVAAARSP